MSKPLRAEPEAVDELRAGAQRYEERRAELGTDFLAAAKAAASRIAQVPTIGSLVRDVPPELGVRQVFLSRFP